MNPGDDKSWPPIAPTELKLSRHAPAEPAPQPADPGTPQNGGPPAPAPGGPAPQQTTAPLSLRAWLVRILVASLLLGSLGLLYWSYGRLIPAQKQSRVLGDKVAKLGQDIALMENQYSPQTLEKLAEEFQFAGQLLFGGEQALTEWFAGLQRQLVPLALEASAEFGAPISPGTTNLAIAVVPATLTLNLEPALDVSATRSPYARVLSLLDELGRQPQRVDLVELEVTAGDKSINRVKAVLELWAGEGVRP